ncbi:MAG: hypothetical protein WC208_01180, partial [Gallionella sp.]
MNKTETPPLYWIAVAFGITAIALNLCVPLLGWDVSNTFGITGIFLNLCGTVSIAAGVKLSSNDLKFVEEQIKSKPKHIKAIGTLLSNASQAINIGIAYIVVGYPSYHPICSGEPVYAAGLIGRSSSMRRMVQTGSFSSVSLSQA